MVRVATRHIPLNLKMAAERIQIGKDLAQRHGTTVSAMVSEIFAAMARLETDPGKLHPILEQLAGMAQDPGLRVREVVMEALEGKYGSRSGR